MAKKPMKATKEYFLRKIIKENVTPLDAKNRHYLLIDGKFYNRDKVFDFMENAIENL